MSGSQQTVTIAPFLGTHCETVATGTLLTAAGVEVSEAMLFGLGEGLRFVFLNLASLPLPFVGGRPKPFELTLNLCGHLGVERQASETNSKAKAWRQLSETLAQGVPAGLQVDCFYLDYFRNAPHFAGHFLAAVALEGDEVCVVDTVSQGTLQRVTRGSIEAARHAKGPMSASARMYTVAATRRKIQLAAAVRSAIRGNAVRYLTPSFSGMGAPGILRLARSLPKWIGISKSPATDFQLAADLMERAGTGGGLFRNLYRDFLAEAILLLPGSKAALTDAHSAMREAASKWTNVASLLERAGAEGAVGYLAHAAKECREISTIELGAMQALSRV